MLFKTLKVFLTISFLLALMIFLTGARGVEYAIEHREHTVTSGQTLWGIATKYMNEQDKTRDIREFVYDIRQANKQLDGCLVRQGDVIVIPLAKEVK